MEARQYISEDGTVPVDGVEGQQPGWTQNDTSPSPPSGMELINLGVEMMVQARIADVIRERDEFRERLRLSEDNEGRLSAENAKLRKIAIEKDLKISDYEKELEQKQSVIDAYKSGNINLPAHEYDFVYDATNFAAGATADLIESFFLKLQSLAQAKTKQEEWLIDCAAAVIPVFIILTKGEKINKAYRYTGTLKSFCSEWNANVASRIEDEERAKKLTCDYDSIKTQMSRAPYKGSSPALWQRMLNEGKDKKVLKRAVNVKVRMEGLFA